MQSDVKTAKSKIKLKNVVTVQQEKLLDERAASQEIHVGEINGLKESLQISYAENERVRMQLDEFRKKVDESKAIIEDNNHGTYVFLFIVIEWLHKQLNDDALNRPIGSSFVPKQLMSNGFEGIDFEKFAIGNEVYTCL